MNGSEPLLSRHARSGEAFTFSRCPPHRRLRVTRLLAAIGLSACATRAAERPAGGAAAPALVRGEFTDDYRGQFSISDSVWFQRPRNRFRVVEWHLDEMYLIAQNAPDDPAAPGLWTRIDWLPLDNMKPFTWGFCLTAFKAPTREVARDTPPAARSTPRTGCNGFPFTRMQRVTAIVEDSTRT
jgi:hypothetical protein